MPAFAVLVVDDVPAENLEEVNARAIRVQSATSVVDAAQQAAVGRNLTMSKVFVLPLSSLTRVNLTYNRTASGTAV